jgi:hypothetical protein
VKTFKMVYTWQFSSGPIIEADSIEDAQRQALELLERMSAAGGGPKRLVSVEEAEILH